MLHFGARRGAAVETVITLAVLAFIGFWVWQFIQTRRALATTTVQSRHAPDQVMKIVDSKFRGMQSSLWRHTTGPGTINKRRTGINDGIIMSIDVSPLSNGGSQVEMWASEGHEYLGGLVNFAGSVNSRKKAIARAVAA
jgi:hypothetical protein